jgi:Flp pilus assembly protein TadD
MKRIAWNFAASGAVLGVTTFGCMMNGVGTAPASAYQTGRSDQQAGELFQRAGRAIADNKIAEAVSLLEQAVMLAPRDAGYRLMLAEAYMKSGRFQSAEAAYRDVLEIDPARARAGLGLALMQVANGRQQDAMTLLQKLEGVASPADLGLAYAIAGAPQRAIELLEPAARSMGATPRVRQNLALAYAFGGDWQRARTIAAQDVSPADLATRMSQWATMTQQSRAPDQVASLLGVNPVRDAGQPVQLALRVGPPAVIAAPSAYAEAQVPVVVPEQAPVVAATPVVPAPAVPVVVAAVEPQPAQPVATEPKAVTTRIAYAEAAPAAVIRPVATEPAQVAPPVIEAPAVETAAVEPAPVVAPAPVEAAPAAPVSAPVAFAEAQPAEVVPAPVALPTEAEAETTEFAELETPEWGLDERGAVTLPKEAPAAEQAPARVQYAAAAENLVRPDPVLMPVASRATRALAPTAARGFRTGMLPGKRVSNGNYVVQIGAFSSAKNADRAWQTYEQRFGLKAEQPVTMTIDHNGRLLHRVAISGFGSRKDATQVCTVIRTRGGECFVRNNAGDAAINWAARYTRRA